MAGIGFVRDAQTQAKQNRENLKNKTNFQRTYKPKFPKKALRFKKVTPEELQRFRTRFLMRQKQQKAKTIYKMLIAFGVIGLMIWFLFF